MVAYRGSLVGIFTNRKRVWETILEIFGVNEKELKSRKRTITGDYNTFGDWRLDKCDRHCKSISSLGTLTGILLKTKNLCLRDSEYPDERVSLHERFLNDIDMPDENIEFKD